MKVDEHIHHWFSAAQHDIDSADLLLEEYRVLDCLVFCHRCLQKMLKGIWVMKTSTHPPQTSNLLWLLREQEIQPPDDALALIMDLTTAYQKDQWPLEAKLFRKSIKKDQAEVLLRKTEEVIRWLKEHCTN